MKQLIPKYVIVDIDGTLADVRHRLHHVEGPGKKNWKAFFAAMDRDKPVREVLEQVCNLSLRHRIIIVTGRPENYRDRTEAWLRKHGVPYQKLFMRKSGDHRPDYEAKSAVFEEVGARDVVLAIDDRPPVCEMYEKRGIKCQLILSDQANQQVNELYRKKAERATKRKKRKAGGF